jgi:hypothetical protein
MEKFAEFEFIKRPGQQPNYQIRYADTKIPAASVNTMGDGTICFDNADGNGYAWVTGPSPGGRNISFLDWRRVWIPVNDWLSVNSDARGKRTWGWAQLPDGGTGFWESETGSGTRKVSTVVLEGGSRYLTKPSQLMIDGKLVAKCSMDSLTMHVSETAKNALLLRHCYVCAIVFFHNIV